MNIDKILLNAINNKASKEEYSALEEWQSDSVKNIEFLETMSMMQSKESQAYESYDPKESWGNIESQLDSQTPKNSRGYYKWMLLALALVALLSYFTTRPDTSGIYTTDGERKQMVLADNSEIWLNHTTTLTETSDFVESRNVSLDGEAFFDVEHVEEKPFIIALNDDNYIRVVGTSFNVLNRGDDFDLSVYTGHVQLHVLDRTIDVYKGERVVLINGSYAKVKNQNPNTLSWRDRVLFFDNERLDNVLVELSDYYNIKITNIDKVADPNCRIRTKYENESLDNVMTELESLFSLKYNRTDDTISIISAICE